MLDSGNPPPERCTLTVKHLKRVVSDRTILQDISFAITTGEVLFVRGPSGVGKSLLLRCLAHLDPISVRTPTPGPGRACRPLQPRMRLSGASRDGMMQIRSICNNVENACSRCRCFYQIRKTGRGLAAHPVRESCPGRMCRAA